MLDQASCDTHEYLFFEGKNSRSYDYFGAHLICVDAVPGVLFRVWAEHAVAVSLIGDFNGWDALAHPMAREGQVWSLFMPGMDVYDTYKYAVTSEAGKTVFKADPYAVHSETRPGTASKVYSLDAFSWSDDAWLKARKKADILNSAVNIYEVHLGSWKRHADGNFYTYAELADTLIPYVKEMGFTHIEVLPITEYPFDGSWGYQCTGYFSVTSRYGTPADFAAFIDACHNAGIGVILDWVPAHFPKDAFGLYRFDGATQYEYADPLKGEHPDWGTVVFDFDKTAVRSFLISSAMFFFDKYHIDGIRIDAVASMLYLDYGSRKENFRPNQYGGNQNVEAISFLRDLNSMVLTEFPDVMMIAEESTAWPLVTKPPHDGGLGFNFKWNMGWMNDGLCYIALDPYFRQFHHDKLTFSMFYAFSENYVLPLSHDEVVHLKKAMVAKIPGEYDAQFATLRTFYAYMMAHPGKKLQFMGNEFAQFDEWNENKGLCFDLLSYPRHSEMQVFCKTLNCLYKDAAPLWQDDHSWSGFQWLCPDDNTQNVLAFERIDRLGNRIVAVMNFSPNTYDDYRLGVTSPGTYRLILNSDDCAFGGNGLSLANSYKSEAAPINGREASIRLKIPALSALYLSLPAKNSKSSSAPKSTRVK